MPKHSVGLLFAVALTGLACKQLRGNAPMLTAVCVDIAQVCKELNAEQAKRLGCPSSTQLDGGAE